MSLLSSIFGGNQTDVVDDEASRSLNNTLFDNKSHNNNNNNTTDGIPSPPSYTYPTRRELAREKKNKASSNNNNNKKTKQQSTTPADPSDQERMRQKKRKKSSEDAAADDDVDKTNEGSNNNNNSNNVKDRTIFVGNLPLVTTTRKSLAKLFRGCGPIESTRIRSVPVVLGVGVKLPQSMAGNQDLVKKICANNTDKVDKSGSRKSTVQGYVVFQSVESIPAALKLNNTVIPDAGGGSSSSSSSSSSRRIRVDHAKTNYDARRSVFVGNLPYNADESTLQEHFAKTCQLEITDVEGVRIVRDKETYAAKGFGYVLFRDRAMVATALQRVPETVYMDRPLRVMVCGRRFKGKNGSDSSGNYSSSRKKAKTNDASSMGALKRILAKQQQQQQDGGSQKKRRARATKKSGDKNMARQPGVSKRAAAEAKVDKRVRKIQKRIKQGMGKARR